MPFEEGHKHGEEHRFKPGESGNPEGRPPGIQNSKTRLLRWLQQELDVTNPATKQKERATVLEMMDAALIQKALKGDVNAYRELVDRFEGKVVNKSEHSGPDGKDLFPSSLKITKVDGSTPSANE